ncbi:MAG: hypothetical protein ACYDIA_24480 [Candidatus Humimicrobiaceae bacterium]
MPKLGLDRLKLRPKEQYIALDELDFSWGIPEKGAVIHMWEQGISLADISKEVRRDPDEVALLLMDLARKDVIKRRSEGA